MSTELALVGIIIFIGFIGDIIFKKTDIPSVIWLMMLGLLLGPIGLGYLDQGPFMQISQFFAAIAVIIILFDGGIDMDLFKIMKEAPKGIILTLTAFVGTLIVAVMTMSLVGLFMPGITLLHGILLGAIIGGTSSAVVIPMVSKLKGIRESTKMVLSIESAITDVLCIIVAIAIIEAMQIGSGSITEVFKTMASQFSIGIILGGIIGLIWLPLMKKINKEDYAYAVTLGLLFLIYAVVDNLGGSGAIACLTFGIILGNGSRILNMIGYDHLAYEIDETSRNFHKLISFIIRTFFFVFLGILVSIQNPINILIGIVISAGILLIRPTSVKIITKGAKEFPELDKKIMAVMMPRGLAAAVLAYMPIAAMPNDPVLKSFADIAFTVIITTTLIATIGTIYYKKKNGANEEEEKVVRAEREASKNFKKPQVIESPLTKKKRRRKKK